MWDAIFPGAGAVAGLLGGIFSGGNKTQRVEEQYNRDAAKMLRTADARNNHINPAATARAQQQAISSTQQGAVGAAANAVAGQMATSGDYSNAMGAGVQMAQATQAAAAPFSQQISQAIGQADQTRLQQTQAGTQIAGETANLSNHVSYVNKPGENIVTKAMAGMQGGANALSNVWGLTNRFDKDVNGTTIINGQKYIVDANGNYVKA